MPDKYDEAIEALTNKTLAQIDTIWGNALEGDEPGSALFKSLGPNPNSYWNDNGTRCCGCLTQIRGLEYTAGDDELTRLVQEDDSIPDPYDGGIQHKHLPIFAKYQRMADKIHNRD